MARVLKVLLLALEKLRDEKNLPRIEEDVDRRLSLKAREVYRSLKPKDRPQGFNLTSKAEPFPAEAADLHEDWVRKRPDFKWRMQDDSALSPEALTKDFDIESKRLGKRTSPSWVLTRNYVTEGIIRFLSESHRYGNNASDGAMIGYVQDWDVNEILADVNHYIRAQKLYAIPPMRFNRDRKAVIQTRQSLKRSEFAPSSFCLHHLWVDLVHNTAKPG